MLVLDAALISMILAMDMMVSSEIPAGCRNGRLRPGC
jgi:hypothetical protein